MAPIEEVFGAAGILSQNLTNSISPSTSASVQSDILMCLPINFVVSALLTNAMVASPTLSLIIDNPLNPPTTTLDALLGTPAKLQTIISSTTKTTTTTALISPATNAGATATPPIKATATAEAAVTTAKIGAENARSQAGEAEAATFTQTQSRDPANGPFPGGGPTPPDDVLATAIFLIFFGLGAFTHISIYRANAKRGHKFLLSDLMFDFCMVRVVTCIFRIAWAFSSLRGVVLAALIFQNGGTSVLFAVNLFLAQRLVRSMHPAIGWQPAFGYLSLFLIFSVPVVIAMNIIATSVSFFSVGKPIQLEACEKVLTFGAGWNMMLVTMPLLWVFLASATPGPPPEEFGVGDLSSKASLLIFSATTLAVGTAVKLAALANPAGAEAGSSLFSRSVLYTTAFMLEILTVAAYAYFRFDLTFHIPNGASGPGDYSLHSNNNGTEPRPRTLGEVEKEIGKIGVRYELLSSRGGGGGGGGNKQGALIALLYPDSTELDGSVDAKLEYEDLREPKSAKVSRRQSLMEGFRPRRPARAKRSTMYMTETLPSWRIDEKINRQSR